MDFPIHIDAIIKYGIVHFELLGAKARILFLRRSFGRRSNIALALNYSPIRSIFKL